MEYQKNGLGTVMMNDFLSKYEGFGRRILTTELDKEAYFGIIVVIFMLGI